MLASTATIERIASILSEASKRHIMRKFRNLSPDDVWQKSAVNDLVTVADTATEQFIEQQLNAAFPGVHIVGEEAVLTHPERLALIKNEAQCFIIDPIDGTLNYARGLPIFGSIVAIVEHGVTTGSVIFDPLSGDWLSAIKGCGAMDNRADGSTRRLNIPPAPAIAQMNGLVHLSNYPKELQQKVLSSCQHFDQILWFGCSAYDYRLLSTGVLDFCLGSDLNPWDHAAGQLIHTEAGGYSALITGEPYHPYLTAGALLVAANKDVWTAIQSCFSCVHASPRPSSVAL